MSAYVTVTINLILSPLIIIHMNIKKSEIRLDILGESFSFMFCFFINISCMVGVNKTTLKIV